MLSLHRRVLVLHTDPLSSSVVFESSVAFTNPLAVASTILNKASFFRKALGASWMTWLIAMSVVVFSFFVVLALPAFLLLAWSVSLSFFFSSDWTWSLAILPMSVFSPAPFCPLVCQCCFPCHCHCGCSCSCLLCCRCCQLSYTCQPLSLHTLFYLVLRWSSEGSFGYLPKHSSQHHLHR